VALPTFVAPHDYHPQLTKRYLLRLARTAVKCFDAAHRSRRGKKGEGGYTAGFARAERTRYAFDQLAGKVDWLTVVDEHNYISYCLFIGGDPQHLPIPVRMMYQDEIPEVFEREAAGLMAVDKETKARQLDLFEYYPPGFPKGELLRVRLKVTHNGVETPLWDRRAVDVSCVVLNERGAELYNWSILRVEDVLVASEPQTAATAAPKAPADEVEAPKFHPRTADPARTDKPHEDPRK
jgi:hypothetical protein